MKFDRLLDIVGSLAWFDLALLVQLTDTNRESLKNQLYRLVKSKKLIALKRGMYTLANRYRKVPLQPAELSNALYRPSYLTGLWALSYYGMIPESTVVYTSVTTRTSKVFKNAFGEFSYRTIKRELFFDYRSVQMAKSQVLIATPEKAIVDLWYLEPGLWTQSRMQEMRLSSTNLDMARLKELIQNVNKPKLFRAFDTWEKIVNEEEEDMEIL